MVIKESLPYNIQANIANAFHEENGYLAPEEVAGWLRAYGYNIEVRPGIDKRPVFLFPSEDDYLMFVLRWS